MRGRWVNATGYTLRKIPGSKNPILYEFTLDLVAPMTLVLDDGRSIRPDRHETTDMGSIPALAQLWVPKDSTLLTFVLHDSGYIKGGLYVATRTGERHVFMPMTRAEVDVLMVVGAEAEGAPPVARTVVYYMVRSFGWLAWNQRRKLQEARAKWQRRLGC